MSWISLPSGKHSDSYWKWTIEVGDLPIILVKYRNITFYPIQVGDLPIILLSYYPIILLFTIENSDFFHRFLYVTPRPGKNHSLVYHS